MTMNGGISMSTQWITVDGNEAAARIAYKTNDVIAIYPITPASPMGEFADAWAASGKRNIFGAVPRVVQMQSEAGAAGAVHGALQAGALATTFTASQGLLLMLPNMYKIAGELHSAVFHIAARAVATHALSIFGDHSDVMAAGRRGGNALSSSVQEAMDLALIAQAATLRARVPFLHVFDGFRTSHEVAKIQDISDDDIRALIDESLVRRHRARGVSPDRPDVRGTAQNPDVFFQSREGANPYYLATPHIVEQVMEEFAERVGRRYELFSYSGHPEAERVIILMGSGCETAEETVSALVQARGEGGRRQGAPLPAVLGGAPDPRPAANRHAHRRAGPDERAGQRRRTALSRRGDGHQPVCCRRPPCDVAARRRRPVWTCVQRVYPGHGEGRL